MRTNMRDYINHLKELHHELNKEKQPTKQIKVKKLELKDEIFKLEQQFAEEYWST
tara:strand:+ start:116 stop:280 length:165 start_codon:yes stop_codon:yes gene_type:complete